jgi:hypothetical protein
MRFKLADRVRVTKSLMTGYIGLSGVIVAAQEADTDILNTYTLKTDDGAVLDFLEYQLESDVTPDGG